MTTPLPHPTAPRGIHPDDAVLFAPEALPRLRTALQEVTWLLDRGYPLPTLLTLAGNHHQLHARQRLALSRVAATPAQHAARRARCRPLAAHRGAPLHLDAFNLLITLEIALARGPLFRGPDAALRDLAGVRGSYSLTSDTNTALTWLLDTLVDAGIPHVTFWLDAPMPSSGRLRAHILQRASATKLPVDAHLVRDADASLEGLQGVVSSDGLVLDRCESWVNLASELIAANAPGAWIVDLGT
ncbi:Hypothetical protein CAP_1643 [Chondromyces apiculatus DSM 436]|uniref:DUF434 domain-containing protein n=2 Tax=Chondromyces apiculatus TaxID=51 RepID=A0A017STB7_9BACT|nr:Hypothetical protein CAP_1643 [Chondromyces apiculatus DSM 436]